MAFPNPYSIMDPCFLNWWKAEVAQGNLTVSNNVGNKQRTVIGQVLRGVCTPHYGFHVAKSALGVLKREGISGLIRRIRNYS
jgi:hypothetical protein